MPNDTPTESSRRIWALTLLPLAAIALAATVMILHQRAKSKGLITLVVAGEEAERAGINRGQVLDATIPGAIGEPLLGRRYKVLIEEESDDRTSGIARIGGRITFIPGARRGQVVLVDTTRVRANVVDAVLVRVLSEVELPPPPAPSTYTPPAGDPTAHVIPGAELEVVIIEPSAKHPDTEGVARINGLVIFVKGATNVGERVPIRIVERRERLALAERRAPAQLPPEPPIGSGEKKAYRPRPGDPVVAGTEMDVIITERSEKFPDREGVTRVGGLVVIVRGVPTIGQRVHIRITERHEHVAIAEPTGKPAGQSPLASSGTPSDLLRRTFSPATKDPAAHVIAGAELETVILEPSRMDPKGEGVAKIGGLVVFVEGGTNIGERVRIRITARRERMAFAEIIERLPPEAAAPANTP